MKLPDTCSRYGITELELCGLCICITAFKHLLRNITFAAYTDHSAAIQIHIQKAEPKTPRIMHFLEILSFYSFVLKYKKGKDMVVADYLSRHPDNDTDDVHEIIPINFMKMHGIQGTSIQNYLRFESLCVMTRSQSAAVNTAPPEIYPLTGDSTLTQTLHNELPEPTAAEALTEIDNEIPEVHPSRPLINDTLPPIHTQKEQTVPASTQEVPLARTRPSLYDLLHLTPVDVNITGYVNKEDSLLQDMTEPFEIPFELKNAPVTPFAINSQAIATTHRDMPTQKDLSHLANALGTTVLHNYNLQIEMQDFINCYARSPFLLDIYTYLSTGVSPFRK